jgi:hypothetical protein
MQVRRIYCTPHALSHRCAALIVAQVRRIYCTPHLLSYRHAAFIVVQARRVYKYHAPHYYYL